MKVGLDGFTIRDLNLGPFEKCDFVKENELEGVLFGGVRGLSENLDRGKLKEIKAHADGLDIYCHVSVTSPNLCNWKEAEQELLTRLTEEIEAAVACGWRELHSCIAGAMDRYESEFPWKEHLASVTRVLKKLRPVLRASGARVNLENHGDATTFEVVRVVEEVGPDFTGICLDTGNVLRYAENPVMAAKRVAPYTHLTHAKDVIIFFNDRGCVRQGRPPGEGVVDWEAVLSILNEYSPNLSLSIEDHKWFREMPIFDPAWRETSVDPELSAGELADYVKLAWQCQKKILSGQLPDPEQYESIPYEEQMMDRIKSGRDHLKRVVKELNMKDER